MQFLFSSAPATFILLLANVMIGVYTMFVDPSVVNKWSFKPHKVSQRKEIGGFVTAAFVHGGLAHLAFNMITLYFFGPLVEGILGTWKFLTIYFGAELAASAVTYWRHKDNPKYSSVGASGAISGVLFAFILFDPFAMLGVMLVIPMPAIVFAVLYIVLSIHAARQGGGFVAHEAHIGGALGGVVLTILLYPAVLRIFFSQLGVG